MIRLKNILTEQLLFEFDKKTNIAAVDATEVVKQLSQEDGSGTTEIWNAMKTATGWAPGALSKATGAKSPKNWVASVGADKLVQRIEKVQSAVKSAKPGLQKHEMPAIEKQDAELVKDALSDKEGAIAVDLASKWGAGDGTGVFDKWWDGLPEDKKKLFDEPGFDNMDVIAQAFGTTAPEGTKESKMIKLTSLLKEAPPQPATGGKPMDGAPNFGHEGEGGPASLGQLKGKAKAFLMKGMLDGGATDSIDMQLSKGISNAAMVPTQGNILIGKSMLFALNMFTGAGDVTDMGGAIVTTPGNEILDGHHRWSGGYIGTGGALSHTNVHKIAGKAADVIPVLATIGNAIGRGNKDMPEEEPQG